MWNEFMKGKEVLRSRETTLSNDERYVVSSLPGVYERKSQGLLRNDESNQLM